MKKHPSEWLDVTLVYPCIPVIRVILKIPLFLLGMRGGGFTWRMGVTRAWCTIQFATSAGDLWSKSCKSRRKLPEETWKIHGKIHGAAHLQPPHWNQALIAGPYEGTMVVNTLIRPYFGGGWVPWITMKKTPHLQLSLTILASPLWCKMRKLMAQHNNTIAGDHRWVFPMINSWAIPPNKCSSPSNIRNRSQKKRYIQKTHCFYAIFFTKHCAIHASPIVGKSKPRWFKITEKGPVR